MLLAATYEGLAPGAWLAREGVAAARACLAGRRRDWQRVAGLLEELRQGQQMVARVGANVNQVAARANATGEVAGAAPAVLEAARRHVSRVNELVERLGREL